MLKLEPRAMARFNSARERLYATGFYALGGHDLALALEAFGLMAAMCPLDQRPWLGLGAAYEQLENWEQARGFYRVARGVAGHSVWPLLGSARVLAALGQRSEACGLLDRAEQLANDELCREQIARLRGNL
jgi:Flp pilus assembly protein TadD